MISNQYTIMRYCIILFISFMVVCTCALKYDDYELKLLNVVFRHGDRTPEDSPYEKYPNDPYLNYSFYPMGRGQLTKIGMQREFKLGEYLRKRYDNYFGPLYIPKTIEARSSDYDRTKASLQLVLAGLFPTKGIEIWNPRLRWQPIPAKYVPRVYDNLFLGDECPRYLDEYNKVLESADFKRDIEPYEDLISELTKYTGKNISTPLDISYLYHTLMAEYSMGLPLPAWTKPLFPYGRLYNATIVAYKAANYNKSLRKIYGGAMLKEFIKNIVGYVNGTFEKDNKLFVYSGHETNIASLLYSLNVYKPHAPAYSSSIFMELLYKDGIYYVRILYYLGIPLQLETLQLPGCEEVCPLDKFFQLTIDDIPSEEDMVCDKTTTPDYADQKYDPNRSIDLYNYIKNYNNNNNKL
ncbi:PREDICTED: venom acid phosphatase Acph-1-like [Polistes dominula]|uniref:acid phosphatase n=1 Tax=Polistes dominula TaxID=743375 RepID=A0ABM1IJ60_POLDO|nr:PREDICTED: venom acid phosphatase Acph-1-like [Polistes dominula]